MPLLWTLWFSKCSAFSLLLFSFCCSAVRYLYCAHYLLLDAGNSQTYIFIDFIFLNTFSAISTIWELLFWTYLSHTVHVDIDLPGALVFLEFSLPVFDNIFILWLLLKCMHFCLLTYASSRYKLQLPLKITVTHV